MLRRQGVEIGPRQSPNLAVAQRRDAAGALAFGQQRHLAHDVAGRDLGDQARLLDFGFVVPEDAEAAARHQIDGIGGLAAAEQRDAAGQGEQLQLALDRSQAPGVEFRK